MARTASVTVWDGAAAADEHAVQQRLHAEGLRFYSWSNGPGDTYAAHTHSYGKIIHVGRGSITFLLPGEERSLVLRAGDRLDLPCGVVHAAQVGPEGVLCYEAHLP